MCTYGKLLAHLVPRHLCADCKSRVSMPPCPARPQHGGFLPAVRQIANVAALPGIVKVRRQQLLTASA